MADQKYSALAIAFLLLVLMAPQTVLSGKFTLPRIKLPPRTGKQVRDFFKDHASDMANLFPSDGKNYNDESRPGTGAPSNGGGRSQAPATNAGMYVLSFSVGTAPQPVSGALDITSELVWTQCSCADDDCGATTTTAGSNGTLFDPSESSTMANESCSGTACQSFIPDLTCTAETPFCDYIYMYGDGRANTTGYLATDKFWFDSSDDAVELVFGCGLYNVGDFGGVSGVIGLGRGNLSLVSQLGAGRFSYYFAPDDGDEQSFILFGDDAKPMGSAPPSSTPLLASSAYPNFYYVGLTGIRVDGQDLAAIPAGTFDLQTADGSGGVFLSIKIPVTFLDERAYQPLKEALVSKIGLPTVDGSALGLDLCYTSQSLGTVTVPAMALVFGGNSNAVMELQTRNYLYGDAVTGLECLAILPSTAGSGSLLGNLIQAGMHMMYDDLTGPNPMLLFESLQQASPPPSHSSKGSPRILFSVLLVSSVYLLYWAAF